MKLVKVGIEGFLHQTEARQYKIPITYIFSIVKVTALLNFSDWIIILKEPILKNTSTSLDCEYFRL